jgi:AcrR family transcriptional regulator
VGDELELLGTLLARSRPAGARRPEVLDAVLAVIVERGFERTRFADVAERSGVAVATLQYLFSSREGMLVAAFEHGVRRDLAYLDRLASTNDPWRELADLIRSLVCDDAGLRDSRVVWIEFWHAATRDDSLCEAAQVVYSLWRDRFAAAIERGVALRRLERPADLDQVITLLFAMLDGAAIPIALGINIDRAAIAERIERWLEAELGVTAATRGTDVE